LLAASCAVACSRSEILEESPLLVPAVDAGQDPCAAFGTTECSGACVDLQNDDANCGACGHACTPGSGGCVGGVCSFAACPTGFQSCAGRCVDTRNDPAHCGGCAVACPRWDGCAGGQCTPACPFEEKRYPVSPTPNFRPGPVTIGDLNGDGQPDLAVGGSYGGPNQSTLGEVDVLFNQGAGAFLGPDATPTPQGENVGALVVAPLLGSATSDLVAFVYDYPPSIQRSDGHGGFVPGVTLSAAPLPLAMAVADFDRDGRLDVSVVEEDQFQPPPGSLITFLNQGGAVFNPVSVLDGMPMSQPSVLLPGDLDGDGIPDLVGLPVGPQLRVYLGKGDGTFNQLGPQTLPAYAVGGALGDVDGNGTIDLVMALNQQNAAIYLGDGKGAFTAGATLPGGNLSLATAVVDFDGDGHQDIAVLDFGGTLSVFPGLGGGRFGDPAVCDANADPQALTVGDVDGDGSPDVVTTNYAGEVAVLLYRGHP
jgi:hypothetical protein